MRVLRPSGSLTHVRYRHRPSGSRRTGIGEILLAGTTRPCMSQPCHDGGAVEQDSTAETSTGDLPAPSELVHSLAVDAQQLCYLLGAENLTRPTRSSRWPRRERTRPDSSRRVVQPIDAAH